MFTNIIKIKKMKIAIKSNTIILIIVLLALTNCKSSKKETNVIPLKDFTFKGIFGSNNDDKNNVYCILGHNYFSEVHTDNEDSLFDKWLSDHPKANVIKICSHPRPFLNNQDIIMIYCWIVDGNDTLNNYLIKQGCFPGRMMQRTKNWEELTPQEKEMYDEKYYPKATLYVDSNAYNNYIEQIKSAERYARNNKKGLWEKEWIISK